jgi:hypothetical protein
MGPVVVVLAANVVAGREPGEGESLGGVESGLTTGDTQADNATVSTRRHRLAH